MGFLAWLSSPSGQRSLCLVLGLFVLLTLVTNQKRLDSGFLRNLGDFREILGEFHAAPRVNWSSVQQERLKQVRETCDQLRRKNLLNFKYQLDMFLLDRKSETAYCHIPKVATTWWMTAYARNWGVPEEQLKEYGKKKILHEAMLRQSVPGRSMDNSAIYKMTFVRHPQERLVSAYVNKFVKNNGTKEIGFHNGLRNFLRSVAKKKKQDGELSFPNLVEQVLYEDRLNKISYGTLHWMPYYKTCQMCNVRFSQIGQMETMSEDVDFFASRFPHMKPFLSLGQKLNSNDKVYESIWPWSSSSSSSSSGSSTESVTRLYLSQLSPDQRRRLCEMYKSDFRMFGYKCIEI